MKMTLSVAEKAAQIAEHLARHDAHGYSQPGRAGIGTGGHVGETVTLSDGSTVGISTGDRDCTSLAIECYAAQGVDCGGAWYSGDMASKMPATGNFELLPRSTWRNPKRGDILLAVGKHAAVALGGGKLAEALRSERHSTDGASGDQDGGEILIRALYDDGWDYVIRYCGPEMEEEVTNEDIERIAQLAADKVVNYELNGVLLRDRIIGTDNAANGANNKLADTSDPTGREMHYNDHDHIKWLAAGQAAQNERLDSIETKIDALGVMLSKDA